MTSNKIQPKVYFPPKKCIFIIFKLQLMQNLLSSLPDSDSPQPQGVGTESPMLASTWSQPSSEGPQPMNSSDPDL